MNKDPCIAMMPGNTPITEIPIDYYPSGSGFWFAIPEGLDAGKKLFFRDRTHGEGEPAATIVFVHGNPECSYIYRDIIDQILTRARQPCRIVAMDHIGFGLSDQASFEMVCMDHADNLLQLIRHLDLKQVTLVIHDWGGPIGIGAFLKEPERVANLVITNTTVFPMPEAGYTYKNYPIRWLSWSNAARIIPDFLWGDYSSYAIYRTPAGPFPIISGFVKQVLARRLDLAGGKESTAQRVFRQQLESVPNTKSSKRLVRQSALWGHANSYDEPRLGRRDTGPFYRSIQGNIGRFWGPRGRNIGVRALLGRWDPLGKDEVVAQWMTHLPQLAGHVTLFEGVGHFVEVTKHREIAAAIVDVAKL
ncbi:MAG: alpha/beta fold hydrolase [Deltaproteobacteria bacterium]|nr:alpha/beta fold hydrolase [Deltaproteobacteria bacterium]